MPNTDELPKSLAAFIWFFAKNDKLTIFIFLCTSLFLAFEASFSPYLLKIIVDRACEIHGAALINAHKIIFWPAFFYALMSMGTNLNYRLYDYLCLQFIPKLKKEITTSMFSYLSNHSHCYFQQHFSGTLTNKVLDMSRSIDPVIQIPNESFIPIAMGVLIAGFSLSFVHLTFTFILFIWVLIFIITTYKLTKVSEIYSENFAEGRSKLNGHIVDSISNMFSVKIFSNAKYESSRINNTIDDVVAQDRKLQWHMLKVYFIQGILVTVLIIAMLASLIYGFGQGRITSGDFAFVLMLSTYIITNIWNIGAYLVKFSKEVGTCKQALSIIIAPYDITDTAQAKPLIVTAGSIEFRNVGFAYSENNKIFSDFSINIPAGQKIGLVGDSGGGKSTFINLILRLFEIQTGSILIDGQAINQVQIDSLRSQIALIPQDPSLFNRSLIDNIRYGKLSATTDEVIAASKLAHCHGFIMELDNGYDSFVGDSGIKLSGGQRQRIAIARAILKQAKILILDEATSALDSITEKYIQDSLHKIMHNRTTIVIAHRLSTLSEMDRILFFKKGVVVEDGTLDQLKNSGGDFAKLWQMQAGGFLPKK
jgi:ATP-binding cassette, subfamily B, bacterial